ncbi:hypothetical protein PTI98_005438 [Pleurotus ostreatus]|nr:hypothetical protein PTI98_005438 [Pleurotus ostreatus]
MTVFSAFPPVFMVRCHHYVLESQGLLYFVGVYVIGNGDQVNGYRLQPRNDWLIDDFLRYVQVQLSDGKGWLNTDGGSPYFKIVVQTPDASLCSVVGFLDHGVKIYLAAINEASLSCWSSYEDSTRPTPAETMLSDIR